MSLTELLDAHPRQLMGGTCFVCQQRYYTRQCYRIEPVIVIYSNHCSHGESTTELKQEDQPLRTRFVIFQDTAAYHFHL